ncbi:hypothetical protein ACSAZK_07915 [Methanosarcina sp. Mfa9]|uniref:hypothetical protein n=1 Tax=Methanosarcina sp. Mfa9 TaxID=3439063 RepID=UPI003F87A591
MTYRKFGIVGLLAVMLLASVVVISALSANSVPELTTEVVEPAEIVDEERIREDADGPEVELIVEEPGPVPVNPISENRPYWYLLIADPEQQKVLFSYIDNCYVSDEEKNEMKMAMEDIWNRYPDRITEKDYLMLEKVDVATAEYLNYKHGVSTEEGVSGLRLHIFNEGSKDHELLVKIYDKNETCLFSEGYFLAHEEEDSSPGIFAEHGTYIYELTLDGNITETYEFVLDTYCSSTVIIINDSDSGTPISITVESLYPW